MKFLHSANNKIAAEFYKSGMNLVVNFLSFPNISSKIRLHKPVSCENCFSDTRF